MTLRRLVVLCFLPLVLGLSGCSGEDDPGLMPADETPSSSEPEAEPTETFTPPDGVTTTELGTAPVGLAVVDGEVWAALINAGAARAPDGTEVPVGSAPLRMVATPEGLWVSVISDGKVVRIDPVTMKVDLEVELKPAGSEPEGLAYVDGTVWVVDQAGSRVLPVDSATGEVGKAIATGEGPRLVSAGPAGLWVGDYVGETVTLVTPDGKATTSKPLEGCTSPQGLAEAGGTLWVACTIEGVVVGVDTKSLQVVTTFEGIDSADQVVTDGKTVYVAGQRGPTLWAIDPKTTSIGDPIALDEQLPVGENVDQVLVGKTIVVSHPDAQLLYEVPLSLF